MKTFDSQIELRRIRDAARAYVHLKEGLPLSLEELKDAIRALQSTDSEDEYLVRIETALMQELSTRIDERIDATVAEMTRITEEAWDKEGLPAAERGKRIRRMESAVKRLKGGKRR